MKTKITKFLNYHGYIFHFDIRETNRRCYAGKRKVYIQRGYDPPDWVLYHEAWHMIQIERAGFWWRFKYFFNTKAWESEANIKAGEYIRNEKNRQI
jgi:hypothetical protein